LAIYEKTFGPDHLSVAMSLSHLATLYRKTGRPEEAESLETRATRIKEIKQ
jgi:hypothetical protein